MIGNWHGLAFFLVRLQPDLRADGRFPCVSILCLREGSKMHLTPKLYLCRCSMFEVVVASFDPENYYVIFACIQ
jgi:hypothetical protein